MTYQALQDAITKARPPMPHPEHDPKCECYHKPVERNAHLDTLQAILNRHTPVSFGSRISLGCAVCCAPPRTTGIEEAAAWPCPDVLTVETALRNMGAL